jgi:hypothetical protein
VRQFKKAKKQCYGYLVLEEELSLLPEKIPFILVPSAYCEGYVLGLALIPYKPCVYYHYLYKQDSAKEKELKEWATSYGLYDENDGYWHLMWYPC